MPHLPDVITGYSLFHPHGRAYILGLLICLCALRPAVAAVSPTPTDSPTPTATIDCCVLDVSWGGSGSVSQAGALGLAVDDRYLYVTWMDSTGGRGVRCIDRATGVTQASPTFALTGDPRGVAVTGDSVFVAETSVNRVGIYDKSGNPRGTIGGYGFTDGLFSLPWGIWTDPAGDRVFISDESGRVQRFERDAPGAWTYHHTNTIAGLIRPDGILVLEKALGGNDVVFVSDPANGLLFRYVGSAAGGYVSMGAVTDGVYQPRFIAYDGLNAYVASSFYGFHVYAAIDPSASVWGPEAYHCDSGGFVGIAVDAQGGIYTPSSATDWVNKYKRCSLVPLPTPTPTPFNAKAWPEETQVFVHPSPVRGREAWAAYTLSGPGRVALRVVNASGELVTRLEEWKTTPGRQRSRLSLAGAAPGVYILKVDVDYDAGGRGEMQPRKFVVIR